MSYSPRCQVNADDTDGGMSRTTCVLTTSTVRYELSVSRIVGESFSERTSIRAWYPERSVSQSLSTAMTIGFVAPWSIRMLYSVATDRSLRSRRGRHDSVGIADGAEFVCDSPPGFVGLVADLTDHVRRELEPQLRG